MCTVCMCLGISSVWQPAVRKLQYALQIVCSSADPCQACHHCAHLPLCLHVNTEQEPPEGCRQQEVRPLDNIEVMAALQGQVASS